LVSINRMGRLGRAGCALAVLAAGALYGCGGDDSAGTTLETVSVTVTGLASSSGGSSLVLLDNGGDALTVTAPGTSHFATQLAAGASYSVSIQTQPAGQVCTLTGASGTVPASGGVTVAVACQAAATYAVGGTVTGLPPGTSVQLLDNGGDAVIVGTSGNFKFDTPLASGATYAVTIGTQPTGATCAVAGGNGTIASAPVTNVSVTCTPTGLTSSTTSSTAFAVLATGNARIAFLPGSLGVVPVTLDGSAVVSSADRARAQSVRKTAASATAPLVGLSFSPDACTVDSSKLIVTCISYDSTKLAFLDVAKFATTLSVADIKASEFESGAPATSTSFSGGSCVLCGIVAVTGQGQVVVSAFDGYRVYAYPAAGAASPLTPVQSYAVPVTENFAVDPVRLYIAASEYYSSGKRTLRLIDMGKHKVYSWVSYTDQCATNDAAICANDFSYEEVDSETFDLSTGMLVLQSESGNSELMLDLSQATFDDTALTFDAPHQYFDVTNPYYAEMSGALASPSGSYLFMVPEFSSAYAGVEALPAKGSGGVFSTFTANPVFVDLNAQSAASPCGGNLMSGGDPHSEGFTTTLAGVDVGLFITDDRTCVVAVNLKALYNAPRSTTAANQVDPAYDLVANKVITYIKVQ